MKQVILCVLAGGESRRFGSPKTQVTIQGIPLCPWIACQLKSIVDITCLSTAEHVPPVAGSEAFDQIIIDRLRHAGPLAAMLNVVETLTNDTSNLSDDAQLNAGVCDDRLIIFATADMPLVSPDRISLLMSELLRNDHLAGVMNVWTSNSSPFPIEPFPSVWRLLPARIVLSEAFSSGIRAPHRLASDSRTELIPIESQETNQFLNVNTPIDLQALKKLRRDLLIG